MAKSKLSGNAKKAVDCLRALKRKTKSETEKQKITKAIKKVKKSCSAY